jgi:hypothetical protein
MRALLRRCVGGTLHTGDRPVAQGRLGCGVEASIGAILAGRSRRTRPRVPSTITSMPSASLSTNIGADDARDGMLAGDDGAVPQGTARICDHCRSSSYQRGPGRRRGLAGQHLTCGERVRLCHTAHHPRAATRYAATRARASHHARPVDVQPQALKPPAARNKVV